MPAPAAGNKAECGVLIAASGQTVDWAITQPSKMLIFLAWQNRHFEHLRPNQRLSRAETSIMGKSTATGMITFALSA